MLFEGVHSLNILFLFLATKVACCQMQQGISEILVCFSDLLFSLCRTASKTMKGTPFQPIKVLKLLPSVTNTQAGTSSGYVSSH